MRQLLLLNAESSKIAQGSNQIVIFIIFNIFLNEFIIFPYSQLMLKLYIQAPKDANNKVEF